MHLTHYMKLSLLKMVIGFVSVIIFGTGTGAGIVQKKLHASFAINTKGGIF
jgi:hypothetical protein